MPWAHRPKLSRSISLIDLSTIGVGCGVRTVYNSRRVVPVSEAASRYSRVGPVVEASVIMAIQVGPVGDHWVKVLDLEFQD